MHIYIFDKPELVTDEEYKKMLALLPEERRQKAQRYRNLSDGVLCAASYLLLRFGLRTDYGIDSFELLIGDNGKPYLAGGEVFFSFSHCKNGCACLISDSEAGVDIQHPVRLRESVLKRVCSESERALIAASDDSELTFRGIWCQKEAYLKMLGVGIATDMKKADTAAKGFPVWHKDCERYSLAACDMAGKSEPSVSFVSLEELLANFAL